MASSVASAVEGASSSGPGAAGQAVSAEDLRALAAVLRRVRDLGSESIELERAPVPPALAPEVSRQRPRLLSDFRFRGDEVVLELGCRYGAITRLLGERCARVVAVDDDPDRAELARLRTRDLANVSVLDSVAGAPELQRRFDLLVCADVDARASPGPATLAAYWLVPDGAMIAGVDLADLDVPARRAWIDAIDEAFPRTAFYFPYPDHRAPRCLLARDFFGEADLREMVERFSDVSLRDDVAASDLPAHACSALVVAGERGPEFPQLGVMYGKTRPAAPALEARTRFVRHGGELRSIKSSLTGRNLVSLGPLTHLACDDPWVEGWSLQAVLARRARDPRLDLPEIVRPAVPWLRRLEREAHRYSGGWLLPGRYLDATWHNSYVSDGDCRFIDQEWEWHRPVPIPVLLIRSLNYFLEDVESLPDLNPRLRGVSRRRLITRMGRALGVRLSRADFREWVALDAAFYCALEGGTRSRARLHGNLRLRARSLLGLLARLRGVGRRWSPSRWSGPGIG